MDSIPAPVVSTIDDTIQRYGLIQLRPHPTDPRRWIRVHFDTLFVQKMVLQTATGSELLRPEGRRDYVIEAGMRGIFKQRLLQERWPVADLAGFNEGDPLAFTLRDTMNSTGKPFRIREYQQQAVDRWFMQGKPAGGHGVEVSTGGGGVRDREQAISLAVRCRLEGSVGSDFHDPAVPWNPPGRLAKLPDSIRPIWSDFLPA